MAVTRTRSLGNTNIFDGLSLAQGQAKLRDTGKTWLLRTSRTPGMLSFDYLTSTEDKNLTFGAIRFCYLGKRQGEHLWEVISDEDLYHNARFMALLKKVMVPVDASLAEAIQQDLMTYVKHYHFHPRGLIGEQLLPPPPTPTSAHINLNMLNQRHDGNNSQMSVDSNEATQPLSPGP